VFSGSSGQPQTLSALQADLCAGVYDPDCAGLVPLPTTLADLCVSLGGCDPGAQGDGTETVTIDPDGNSLVPINSQNSGVQLTQAELDAYLAGTASQNVIDRVQYTLNYNTYNNQVFAARATQLQAVQSTIQDWENSVSDNTTTAVTLNSVNLIWTKQIRDAYNAAAEAGTDTSNLTVTLSDAWCNNNQDPPSCFDFVKDAQQHINDSLSSLAKSKASFGVNVPPPPKPTSPSPSTKGPLQARTARSSKRKRGKPAFVLMATKKPVTLKPGQKKTTYLRIPGFVRTELKHLLREGKRTLHAHLTVTVSTSNGSYTTRTIPLTIHLKGPHKH
jgi:hypothetical protein